MGSPHCREAAIRNQEQERRGPCSLGQSRGTCKGRAQPGEGRLATCPAPVLQTFLPQKGTSSRLQWPGRCSSSPGIHTHRCGAQGPAPTALALFPHQDCAHCCCAQGRVFLDLTHCATPQPRIPGCTSRPGPPTLQVELGGHPLDAGSPTQALGPVSWEMFRVPMALC